MSKYKVGDVIQFGDEWMLILGLPENPSVTIETSNLFLGGYNPIGDTSMDHEVLFNIFDIKKRIEDGLE